MSRPKIGDLEVFAAVKVVAGEGEQVALLFQGPVLILYTKPTPVGMAIPRDLLRVQVLNKGVTIHPGPTGLIGGIIAALANVILRNRQVGEARLKVWPTAGGEYELFGSPDQVELIVAVFKEHKVPFV